VCEFARSFQLAHPTRVSQNPKSTGGAKKVRRATTEGGKKQPTSLWETREHAGLWEKQPQLEEGGAVEGRRELGGYSGIVGITIRGKRKELLFDGSSVYFSYSRTVQTGTTTIAQSGRRGGRKGPHFYRGRMRQSDAGWRGGKPHQTPNKTLATPGESEVNLILERSMRSNREKK